MITALEVDYENPWIYEGRPFTSDDIGDYYGLFTVSPISAQEGNILEENTSYRKENLKEAREGSQASQIGSDIMEALTILNEILEKLEKTISEERSSPSTQPLEK